MTQFEQAWDQNFQASSLSGFTQPVQPGFTRPLGSFCMRFWHRYGVEAEQHHPVEEQLSGVAPEHCALAGRGRKLPNNTSSATVPATTHRNGRSILPSLVSTAKINRCAIDRASSQLAPRPSNIVAVAYGTQFGWRQRRRVLSGVSPAMLLRSSDRYKARCCD